MPSWMHRLVVETGGAIEHDRFVTRPGCMLVASTTATPRGRALMTALNIGPGEDYADLAELGSRLTYLAFKDSPPDATRSAEYLTKIALEAQHLSIFGASHATFLIAGIAVETSLELVAHREARVARLTTSNTKAMDAPLFRLQGTPEAQAAQRREILAMLGARSSEIETRELSNMQNPGSKVTALTFTMCLKDFHTLFIGRLPEKGNEIEMREICTRMCEDLHAAFPFVIREPAFYAGLDNGKKYGS
jgi:thymidylate synthase ThyX